MNEKTIIAKEDELLLTTMSAELGISKDEVLSRAIKLMFENYKTEEMLCNYAQSKLDAINKKFSKPIDKNNLSGL